MKPINQHFQDVLSEVLEERKRQTAKFGQQNHTPIEFCAILNEEIGEATQAIVDAHFGYKPKAQCLVEFRKELIQVAAVAYQMTEVIILQTSLPASFIDSPVDVIDESDLDTFLKIEGTMRFIAAVGVLAQAGGDTAAHALGILDNIPSDVLEYAYDVHALYVAAILIIIVLDRDPPVKYLFNKNRS